MRLTAFEKSQIAISNEVLLSIPKSQQPFYGQQFAVIGSKPAGSFVGLACKVCNNWLEFGHERGCLAPPISKAAIKRYAKRLARLNEEGE